jgi:hypothetical protein
MTDHYEGIAQCTDQLESLLELVRNTPWNLGAEAVKSMLPRIIADARGHCVAATGENPWEGSPYIQPNEVQA